MITLDDVSKYYQTHDKIHFAVVEPTSLEIQGGEIFGLMGYSGAGKSTLLRLINLLERPDSGRVNVCGQELTALDIAALRQARQDIGMMFQQFNLLSNRTVADNVAFPLEIAGWLSEKIKERIKECLEIVGLIEHADHYPAQLPGGQKQRVGIARALAPKPQVILVDEPTFALDSATIRSALECLEGIDKRFNVIIVITIHEMSVIRHLCDRAALSDKGKVVEIVEVRGNRIHAQSEIGRELIWED